MSSVSYHISNLLEKMTSTDKDFRFMATNDLMLELQKDSIKLDEDSERKVVTMLLKLLEDKNGEVQNLAVKCLAPLVSKVKEPQVETMVDTLCSNMTSDKEQLRDISSMGLKTVIAELPLSSSGLTLTVSVCKKITSQLIGAMGKQEDVSVQLEALDILSDMLGRLSGALVSFHSSLLSSLLPQLTSSRMAVRKRSILALGHLVPCCSPALFSQLTEHLLTELTKGPPTSTTRTYIQCLATISRQGGHRVGEHLEKLIPMVVKFTGVEDDELREYCFQAFEAFIRRCPKEMSPHVATVTQLCLKFMTFDPNYNYDDAEEDEEDSMDIEDGLDEESDDEYSDDDDMSWKVRRSSIKCLEALINTRRDLLLSFYSSICPALLARFKEREENVRADVFAAFSTLLRQTRMGSSHRGLITAGSDSAANREEDPAVNMLKKQVPVIVKALHRQLKEKSIKSRQGCFCLLTELAHTVPGALEQHIPALIPGIVFSLTDKSTSSTMRIDALSFFHVLLLSHPPQAFQPHMQVLLPPVVACIEDTFYKITSEALLVAQQLIRVMRPQGETATAGGFDPKPFVKEVFSVTLKRLKATDIDQEVKERAISCMGHIVCHLGDHLGAELQGVLAIFLERLKNEITRLTAVRTITLISGSPLKINLTSILPETLSVLGSFLRKNQRALKLGTLACLTALVTHHAASIKPAALEPVLSELPALVDESDMHVSQVSVTLLTCMAKACPSSLAKISSSVLPGVFRLVHSPLLQGGALAAILDFLHALVLSKTCNLGYSQLLKSLTDPFHSSSADSNIIHRQSYQSVARCVAALTSSCPKETPATVAGLLQEVKNPKSPESARVLALLCLGEVGRSGSLGGSKEVQGVILEAISSTNEEVKTAASCALGSMAVGSLNDYLPFLLKEISSQPRRQYLLLHSLKEVISACPASSLSPHVESIWALLLQNCECQEEGTRNLVAECLGKLTLVNAAQLLPRLKQQLRAGSPLARSTVVTAVKFTIIDQPAPIDALLKDCIGDFLKTLQDNDINVRRVALVMFNSAAHNKPSLIRGLLATVLPHLYKETQIRKDLIREVEMGPFKHTVDDGLDVRKAAFECMYTLLDSCLEALDVLQFLDHVEEGLKDHYDIRMLTFLMLARLASLCPAAVLQRLDRLIEPLKATCTTKVKAGSVKQEFEKQEELRRSAMRAVAALLAVPEVERSPSMADFANQIRTNADMASIYQSVQGGEGGGLGPAESMDMS
ncbi:LOW QUALITY PROTEIN: cullin-associated NEDD8-dissociated protein 1-like [Plectropomus leopardus]|uniref:LOW QUALITY PROTEIN: cullin-associated NEDD8-dissociated protein 1-like n=2 Tax=Plectropomus leopardus TaxID=160734 RepID=UPI001C4B9A2D|nr:LOW QUALITY PROTEIN: cullin-associated NEDD8-dissociated protein 1-like [Plectropomus leopardus]